MSIEMKQAAQQALDAFEAFGEADDFATLFTLTQKMNALHTAIQQAESEPVYWEWRHQGSHPDAVDFGQWSEWKRVEHRSALHTVEDALNEFRGYIARGLKYELRALYTHPAPGVPEGFALVPLKATPKVAMVLYEGARSCFSPKVAEGLWQDALTAAQAQKGQP